MIFEKIGNLSIAHSFYFLPNDLCLVCLHHKITYPLPLLARGHSWKFPDQKTNKLLDYLKICLFLLFEENCRRNIFIEGLKLNVFKASVRGIIYTRVKGMHSFQSVVGKEVFLTAGFKVDWLLHKEYHPLPRVPRFPWLSS